MNDILKQDIFFFVATVAVVILAVLVAVLVYYFIRISRKVDYITDKAKDETDRLSVELASLRQNIRESGLKVKHFASFITGMVKPKSNSFRNSRKGKGKNGEE